METSWREPSQPMKCSLSAQVNLKSVFSARVNTHKEEEPDVGAERFQKFSSSKSLQRAVANLIVIDKEFKHRRDVKAERLNKGKSDPRQ